MPSHGNPLYVHFEPWKWARRVVVAAIIALWAQTCFGQSLAVLDVRSDTAITACSNAGGLAGWLSRIEPDGDYVGPSDPYCVIPPAPTVGWHLDLGLDGGKAFSIVDGGFVVSTIPSITLLFGPVEVSTSSYFRAEGMKFYEQDTHVRWYQREDTRRRWSLFLGGDHLVWPGGSQFTYQGGIRWRVR